MTATRSSKETGYLAPLLLKALPASLGVKVVLVPVAGLLIRRTWFGGAGNVLNVVSRAGANQSCHPFRPQRCGDARGTAAPIIAPEDRLSNSQAIHQRQQIGAERRLLTRARCVR